VYKILAAAVYLSCKARHKPAQVDGGGILPDLSTSRTTTYFVVLKDSSHGRKLTVSFSLQRIIYDSFVKGAISLLQSSSMARCGFESRHGADVVAWLVSRELIVVDSNSKYLFRYAAIKAEVVLPSTRVEIVI
jgi:hypothetical protein